MDERRRKIQFRAWRRGFRELDLLMGSFADQHLAELSEADIAEFERLLDVPDWDVYAWISGNKEAPENYNSSLLDRMKQFKYSAHPG